MPKNTFPLGSSASQKWKCRFVRKGVRAAPGICCAITFHSPLFKGQNTPSQCGSQIQGVSESPRPQGPPSGLLIRQVWVSKDFPGGDGVRSTLFRMLFSHRVRLYAVASVTSDSVAPWTVACQAPLSTGCSRQEYWSGLPCPPPGDLPDPGMEPESLMSPVVPTLQAGSLLMSHRGIAGHKPAVRGPPPDSED